MLTALIGTPINAHTTLMILIYEPLCQEVASKVGQKNDRLYVFCINNPNKHKGYHNAKTL